ncbi:hypothetical protein Tco_0200842 [Tanacetum coccineum]
MTLERCLIIGKGGKGKPGRRSDMLGGQVAAGMGVGGGMGAGVGGARGAGENGLGEWVSLGFLGGWGTRPDIAMIIAATIGRLLMYVAFLDCCPAFDVVDLVSGSGTSGEGGCLVVASKSSRLSYGFAGMVVEGYGWLKNVVGAVFAGRLLGRARRLRIAPMKYREGRRRQYERRMDTVIGRALDTENEQLGTEGCAGYSGSPCLGVMGGDNGVRKKEKIRGYGRLKRYSHYEENCPFLRRLDTVIAREATAPRI